MKVPNLSFAVILSLALHFLFISCLFVTNHFFPPSTPPKVVTVEYVSPEELKALNAPKVDENLAKQIVEQDENAANKQIAENAKFLSAKDNAVKKETIAVNKGDFQNTKSKSVNAGKTAAKAGSESKEKTLIKNMFAAYDPNAAFERQKKQQEEQQKIGQNGTEGTPGSGNVSQTNDYAKNVDKGIETLLNAREFKYYSYYNRIRRQLAQHWEGKVREKLTKFYKEHRAPASINEDKITKVIVVLNSVGNLVNVQIVGDSGIHDLDDAAVEAFRAAAPFPNPPKGIVENDGTVKIRWDFVLET